MQGDSKKKTGAAISAAVIVVSLLAFIAAFVLLIKGDEAAGANWVLAIYIGVFAAMVIGVLVSLKKRFSEIESGEEEEAKKY